jgi:hypothetical protein
LFLGTNADNREDMRLKGRAARGNRQPHSVLTPEAVQSIRDERAKGVPCKVLAARFGVCSQHVSYVASGRRWAHVA